MHAQTTELPSMAETAIPVTVENLSLSSFHKSSFAKTYAFSFVICQLKELVDMTMHR